MNKVVLIVEDEDKLAAVMTDYLKQAGFESICLSDGSAVVSWVQKHDPALIMLDLTLPGLDGLEICKEIRRFSSVPIIMTTARVEEIDRLLGLELGADDYICKPFSPREVIARIKAVLRRSNGDSASNVDSALNPNELVLDESRHLATLHGNILNLTAVEFKLLHFLATRAGRIYNRDALMNHIYHNDRIVSERTIDSHIKKLRKKIVEVSPNQELIHSVYGVGYKFENRSES